MAQDCNKMNVIYTIDNIIMEHQNACINKFHKQSVMVKIPHLSKKIHVDYYPTDSVSNFIDTIQSLIKEKEYNYGLLMKNRKRNINRFVNENVLLADIISGDNKIFFMKKKRIFNFNIPNAKWLKTINKEDNQILFVHFILESNLQSLVQLLLEGFDPNYIINDEPPLHYAVVPEDSVALVSLLIGHGAHADYRSTTKETVLHKAVRFNKPETVNIILQFGLHPDVLDSGGSSPLYFCVLYNDDIACFERLLKYQANTSHTDDSGLTILHHVCLNNKLGHLQVLVQRGEDLDIISKISGNSPLHYAVLGGARDCCSFLLDNGVKRDLENRDHLTAFQIAENSFPDMVYLFHNDKPVKEDILEDISDLVDQDKETNIEKVAYSSNLVPFENEELYRNINDNESLRKDSIVSSLSLVAASRLTLATEVEEKIYFGLQTKVVEFIRSSDNSFGFSLETNISDQESDTLFVPSCDIPSIHRMCKCRVSGSTITLFAKPYLLEVNQICVNTMSLPDIIQLIGSTENTIVLRITNKTNSRRNSENTKSIESRVSSAGILGDISLSEQDIVSVIEENVRIAEEEIIFQSVANISTLQLKSWHTAQLRVPHSIDGNKIIQVNYKNINETHSKSVLSTPISLMSKSEVTPKQCEIFTEDVTNKDIKEPVQNLCNSSEECLRNHCRDKSQKLGRIFTQNLNFGSSSMPMPQYGLYRTELVLPLNKSLIQKARMHIPLKIN